MTAKKSQRTEILTAAALASATEFAIAELRKHDGSLSDMATRIGVPYCALHRPMRGHSAMRFGTLVALLDALGFKLTLTIARKDSESPEPTPTPKFTDGSPSYTLAA